MTNKNQWPITDLVISIRVLRILQHAGFKTVGDLIAKTESELRLERNCGPGALSEIKKELRRLGLSLKAEEVHEVSPELIPKESELSPEEALRKVLASNRQLQTRSDELVAEIERIRPAAPYLELKGMAEKAKRLSEWQGIVQTPLGRLRFFFRDGELYIQQARPTDAVSVETNRPILQTSESCLTDEDMEGLQRFCELYQEAKPRRQQLKDLRREIEPLKSWLREVQGLIAIPAKVLKVEGGEDE